MQILDFYVDVIIVENMVWELLPHVSQLGLNADRRYPFIDLFTRTVVKPFCILMKQEMMEWQWHQVTICKSFVPLSRQITKPAPRHSIFYGPHSDAEPSV